MGSSSVRWLFASISALIVCFVVSTLFIERKIARIENEVDHIITNSAPSVVHLTAARTGARRAEVAALQALLAARSHGHPVDRDAIDRARSELDERLALQGTTPLFPDEQPVYDALLAARHRFVAAIDRAYAALDAGKAQEAERVVLAELDPAADELSQQFEQMVRINASHTQVNARNIEVIRERAASSAFLLDSLVTTVGIVLLFLAARATRLYEHLLKADQQAARLRAESLDRFASRVAHDLGTPLATICASAAAAEANPQDALKWVGRIRKSARVLNEMLQALWNLGQLRVAAQAEQTLIAPVLTEILDEVAPAAAQAEATITVEPFAPARAVGCGPGTLALVLSNLLQNAIKYVSAGAGAHEIFVRVGGDDERVRLEIEDTGPGVVPDLQDRIFEAYMRADPSGPAPGLGLGLATLKQLVEMQGGAIGVRSRPGQGACFWVQLAAAEMSPRPPEASA